MKVLITGGAGFIGSNLCRHLAAVGGYEITVFDNLSAGQTEPAAGWRQGSLFGDYTDEGTSPAACAASMPSFILPRYRA